MLEEIKGWIEEFYRNDYQFDQEGFLEIIEKVVPIVQSFSKEEVAYINEILGRILERYESKDLFYVVELFEYEFVPIFE